MKSVASEFFFKLYRQAKIDVFEYFGVNEVFFSTCISIGCDNSSCTFSQCTAMLWKCTNTQFEVMPVS
jgi:hypothetical protein